RPYTLALRPSESPALPSVNDNGRATYPTGTRRCQERDHVADLVRTSEPAKRQLARDELGDGRGVLLLAFPPRTALEQNGSWGHAVDADVRRSQLLGQGLGQGDLGG